MTEPSQSTPLLHINFTRYSKTWWRALALLLHKRRIDDLERALAQARAENADLNHDIEWHAQIESDLATELEELHAEKERAEQEYVERMSVYRESKDRAVSSQVAAESRERAKHEALEKAVTALEAEQAGHGHSHWDAKGTHGTNCRLCIVQREAPELTWEAQKLARAALEGKEIE